ncbi:family 20 glycosylhydrolase [Phocaeicola massiliensis]|jgi:hexosaminidase|uniref:family 20 glycosylhydrolase n=1 Tax=Phocaeicola massiliensis TaxID=204516 RepID=UPI002030EEAD|nr:family 20 glycosylhydrolase [Phocaeicola massiliensis]MCM1614324.1 beta-N-acetylhexosaminidase [Phocaeicola massiliensis]MCM1704953.1 beta-N-acetylhexosaminidase [Phocaeicola massiliensis]
MIRRIVLSIFCCLLAYPFLVARQRDWSLPTPEADLPVALIPYPKEIVRLKGDLAFSSLRIDELSMASLRDKERIVAEFGDVRRFWQMDAGSRGKQPLVTFRQINSPLSSAESKEGYTLIVSEKGVEISAGEFSGFFNALQTVRQLIRKDNKKYSMPYCRIKDAPAFPVRGLMLDVGRNYMSVPFLKSVVRRLSHYKINVLHLHLSDDPGWRVEVKKYPELTVETSFWPTRQPGKFYTQEDIKSICDFCDSLNIRVIPEIDMPGHSAAFRKAIGKDMQTPEGMQVLKEALDEIIPLFKDSLFHIGSDEVHFKMKEFMPEMIRYVRSKGKQVVVWYPGYAPDSNAVRMCWGEYEAGYSLDKSAPYIDCNGFYMDWMDSQGGVLQTFFQYPCEVPQAGGKALGSEMCVWTDGAISSDERILLQYPFYPTMLTFSERIWRGSREKRRDLVANLPAKGTKAWEAFNEFEDRLIYHRDRYFKSIPFAYVKQSEMKWRLIGPFNHHGINDTSFEPEKVIKEKYIVRKDTLTWNDTVAYGGEIQIRTLYAMFNMHRNQYRLDFLPTVMSSSVGKKDGTCYALTRIKSPKNQEVYLMFGLNGMWGHSGGYRSARAPEHGSWDFSGGDVWLNGIRVLPPSRWPFESLPWTGWGKGRIEVPLTEEGYFFRPPVKIKLRKGVNEILVRTVFGHWKGDNGQRKWQFCCMPVLWDGCHYTEVKGLEYLDCEIPAR